MIVSLFYFHCQFQHSVAEHYVKTVSMYSTISEEEAKARAENASHYFEQPNMMYFP